MESGVKRNLFTPRASALLEVLGTPISLTNAKQNIWSLGKSLSEKAHNIFSPPVGANQVGPLSSTPSFALSATPSFLHSIAATPASLVQSVGMNEVVSTSFRMQDQINADSSQAHRVNRALIIASVAAHRRNELLIRSGLSQLTRLQETVIYLLFTPLSTRKNI